MHHKVCVFAHAAASSQRARAGPAPLPTDAACAVPSWPGDTPISIRNEQSGGAEELPFSLFSSEGNAALSSLGQAQWALDDFHPLVLAFCATISNSSLYSITVSTPCLLLCHYTCLGQCSKVPHTSFAPQIVYASRLVRNM